MDCKSEMNGGEMNGGGNEYNDTLLYGGGSGVRLNKHFRGWGFSYF